METISEFILSGRIVDVMLVVMVLEVLVLLTRRKGSSPGARALPLIVNAGAGISLMLALRNALAGGSWQVLAACLFGALVFHVLDVSLRVTAAAPESPGHSRRGH